jgi:glyoxylase-like metal-dependent hydrolase (beta-lactamase superfamily II)
MIIDAGCYSKQEQQVLANFISSKNLKVVKLVNTHCHIDHVLGNAFVKNTYKVASYMHALEENVLRAVPTYAPMYGFAAYQPSEADVFIDETQKLTFGNSSFDILFVPGHSIGHLAFYSKADKFCISGDVLFYNSIGRTDLPGGNHQQLLNSIKQEMYKLPDDTTVYSGHGNPTTIGREKQYNAFCRA